jgi:FkbM family methyltransferase
MSNFDFKNNIKKILKYLIPKKYLLPLKYFKLSMHGELDYERIVLKNEIPSCNFAIDIGANIGIYSYYFSKFCKRIESFEPVYFFTNDLREYIKNNKNINLHSTGLSNQNGNFEIYTPLIKGGKRLDVGLTSLSKPTDTKNFITTKIDLKKLDDYNFSGVELIKIDVEGHEYEVIDGAQKTILKCKPIILIEIEQRHLKNINICDVFNKLKGLGYAGSFYNDKKFHPLSSFDVEKNQLKYLDNVNSNNYINNFIFRPL